MLKLLHISELVKAFLIADERCRNSDSYLYFRVVKHLSAQQGVDIKDLTISDFLLNYQGKTFPCFETVRRTRAKVQECYPELKACETVEGYRVDKAGRFRAYVGRADL